MGGTSHIIGSVSRRLNGNRNVAYLWNDGLERNLDLNWFENDWNPNYRFLAVRNSLCFPPLGGFFFEKAPESPIDGG